MDKEIPIDKFIALDDEVRASINLIHSGLAELQNIDGGNDFYYLPFSLLSNGFEKLLKLFICFYNWEEFGQFPAMEDFKKNKRDNGHNLLYLKNKIINKYFVANTPELQKDLDILSNNKTLNQLIDYLGDFGQYSRYYNLDVIISSPNQKSQKSKDIKQLWEKLESDLLYADTDLYEMFMKNLVDINKEKFKEIQDIHKQIQIKTIILLEIFARALTRQFTLGKLGQAKSFTGTISRFLFLNDKDLGQRDYKELKK